MIDSRTKILTAASELFLEGGASALSVRAIANRAGLSTIGIYSHFKGKQGILDTLYIEGFNMVYDAMDVEVGDKFTRQHLLQSTEHYLRVAEDHEAHYRLIFGEADISYTPSEQARKAADRAFEKLVRNTGSYLRNEGLQVDWVEASMDIWAILHGYVSISHHTPANETRDWKAMAQKAVTIHLDAFKLAG